MPREEEAVNPRRPVVSVLVCSLNVRGHIERCMDALFGRDHGVELQVVLVDNDSEDGTVEMVLERFPEVLVVANRANVGFAQANNQALEHATGDYVLYLNPDTEVGEGTLARCVAELEADSGLGMVGCRLIYPDGEIQYSCARRAYRFGDLLIEAFYLHKLFPAHPLFGRQLLGDWDHLSDREVEGISGAFMMLPRSLAEELGGMATEVFLYHEDMDLCLRVRQAGYRIKYLADVQTVHDANRSTVGAWARRDWSLLELETRVRLIRQIQGPAMGALARVAYAGRSLGRMAIAAAGRLPGMRRAREAYPLAFDPGRHFLQLRWAVSPASVRDVVPRAPSLDEVPPPVVYPPRPGDEAASAR